MTAWILFTMALTAGTGGAVPSDVVLTFEGRDLIGWSDPRHSEWRVEEGALVCTFPEAPAGLFDPWIHLPDLSLLVDPEQHRFAQFKIAIDNPGHDAPMAFGLIWMPHMATFHVRPNAGIQSVGVDLENGSVPWTWAKEFSGGIRLDPANHNNNYAELSRAKIRIYEIRFTAHPPEGLEPISEKERPVMEGLLSIDTARKSLRYDRLVFGGFLEHFHRQIHGGIFEKGSPLSDDNGFRLDVIEAVKEMGITNVRWPGGWFVDSYHWRDGVGPERTPRLVKHWGVTESNEFGTNEFVSWCRLANVEPYICTNAALGTVEEMADWVEYCNRGSNTPLGKLRASHGYPEPHNVRLWSIGNEDTHCPWKTAETWSYLVREASHFMRMANRHDQPMEIYVNTTPPGHPAETEREMTRPLIEKVHNHINGISLHGYYVPNDPGISFLDCMVNTPRVDKDLRAIETALAFTGKTNLKIAFDEWNMRGWYHPGPWNDPAMIKERDRNDENNRYTMADALFTACALNTILRHGEHVRIASIAPLVNTVGPLYVHPEGIVRRPTFHVYKLYTSLLEANVIETSGSSPDIHHEDASVEMVDALVTCDDSRAQFAAALVNRSPVEEVTYRIRIDGQYLDGEYAAWVLQGDNPTAYNSVEHPESVVPREASLEFHEGAVKLPPHSLTVFKMAM